MKKRLPLDKNGIIAKLNVLNIEIALDLKRSPTSIVPLAVHFPHIIPQNKLIELDDQWRACSGFEPGFYVNTVFDLSCLVSPYLLSAFG